MSRGNEKLFSSSVLSQQKYQTRNFKGSGQTTASGATCSTSRRDNLGTVDGTAKPPPDGLQEPLSELIQDKGKIPYDFHMARIVAQSLPPQIVKGFLDKCFSLSDENMYMWKTISVENIAMLNGNAPFSASGSACLPSQLPAQLPSSSLGRCRTSVLQSACKSTF